MKKTVIAMAAATLLASPVFAVSFVNGDFELGNASSWNVSNSAYRANNTFNAALTPDWVYANDNSSLRTQVISSSYVDPHLGATLGSTVYGGGYGIRVEDTANGGYASVISQQVVGYTDPKIFFAWKAVLEGAHGTTDAATMKIFLRDDTDGTDLISRTYNAASTGGGVDSRFTYSSSTGNYYTANWQIEELDVTALSGHTLTLSVLASDCEQTGHWGYVYLDGFGARIPDPTVPEPASLALFGLGLVGLVVSRRRKST